MKLSYFSYDFSACCCEAVNDGGWAGVFRRSGLLCVPVGGGPPARSPHASLTARSGRSRGPPWPCRHPPAPQPGPPVPPAPSTPVGPGRCSAVLRVGLKPSQAPPPPTGTAARHLLGPRPSPPALTPLIPEPTRNFARNSPTSLSNSEIRSLELQRFPTLLKLLPIELRATFPVTSPRHSPVPQPSPTSAKKFALLASISVHTRKSSPSTAQTAQNQRFFACRANFFAVCSRIHSSWASFFTLMGATATSQHLPTTSPETDNTNAGGSLPRDETADTFARTKQPNSGHLPPAKVSRVSSTPHRAPAKALPVSPSPDATPTAQTSRGVRTRHKAGGTLAT